MPHACAPPPPPPPQTVHEISFKGLLLPERHPPHTELLDLRPLPLAALNEPRFQALYAGKFTHFNAIQTQVWPAARPADHAARLPVSAALRRCVRWDAPGGLPARPPGLGLGRFV